MTEKLDRKSPIWIYEKAVPSEICDYIVSSFKNNEYESGTVGHNIIKENVRRVFVQYIPQNNWITSLIHYYGFDANKENFNYTVSDSSQVQFLKYEPGMFYRVHADTSDYVGVESYYRKLTVILNLTDPSEFDGGKFVLYNNGLTAIRPEATKGTVFVFPSFMNHKISPITKGTRYSMVGWIMGPPFA
jgi:PKHD-type hydroxylase